MDSYIVKTAFRMGNDDVKYGQTWYLTVEELDVPVMCNLLSGSIQELDKLTWDTEEIQKFKTGKNEGNEYRRLKKVKVEEGVARVVGKPSDVEVRLTKLEAVVFGTEKMIDKVEETVEPKSETSGYEKAKAVASNLKKTKTDDDIGDEPINLDDIPF